MFLTTMDDQGSEACQPTRCRRSKQRSPWSQWYRSDCLSSSCSRRYSCLRVSPLMMSARVLRCWWKKSLVKEEEGRNLITLLIDFVPATTRNYWKR